MKFNILNSVLESHHFQIQVSEDPQGLRNIPVTGLFYESKKDAMKDLNRIKALDLTNGRYYFYHLLESCTKLHMTSPSPETTE